VTSRAAGRTIVARSTVGLLDHVWILRDAIRGRPSLTAESAAAAMSARGRECTGRLEASNHQPHLLPSWSFDMCTRTTSCPIKRSARWVIAAALIVLAAALAPSFLSAQSSSATYAACYVPRSGTVYRIKAPNTPSACTKKDHVEFSWTEAGMPGPRGPAGPRGFPRGRSRQRRWSTP